MISIVGAPFDLCGLRPGSRLGPEALRLAGIKRSIADIGREVRDTGNVHAYPEEEFESEGMKNFDPLLATIKGLQTRVLDVFSMDEIPLVLGGEHTLSIGSVSAALKVHGSDLAVLWIDAHADINTPATSSTGNIHGMPLAALGHLPSGTDGQIDEEWQKLLEIVGPEKLPLSRIAWFGLRDVDEPERERLVGPAITMHEVDRYGVEMCTRTIREWLVREGATKLWISFDVDALDPFLAPGTGTAVRGGLSYREGHLLAELLEEMLAPADFPCDLVGLDVVETNPIHDRHNETAEVAVEWVASLFGKRILGKRS